MDEEHAELEFRGRMRSKVANILCHIDGVTHPTVGFILHSQERSVYVVVLRRMLFPHATYTVTLPDGSATVISGADFSTPYQEGLLAGFHWRNRLEREFDHTQMTAVELGDNVTMFQRLHLCDFYLGNWNFTTGEVISVDGPRFTHSCGPTPACRNGAPVFNDDGLLVGFCLANPVQGPIEALLSETLIQELMRFRRNCDSLEILTFWVEVNGWYSDSEDEVNNPNGNDPEANHEQNNDAEVNNDNDNDPEANHEQDNHAEVNNDNHNDPEANHEHNNDAEANHDQNNDAAGQAELEAVNDLFEAGQRCTVKVTAIHAGGVSPAGVGFVVYRGEEQTVIAVHPHFKFQGLRNGKMYNGPRAEVIFCDGTRVQDTTIINLGGVVNLVVARTNPGEWQEVEYGVPSGEHRQPVLSIVAGSTDVKKFPFKGEIISPRSTCVDRNGDVIPESELTFTFSLPMVGHFYDGERGHFAEQSEILKRWIFGGPVFDMNGLLVGSLCDCGFSFDFKYAMRAEVVQAAIDRWLNDRQWEDAINAHMDILLTKRVPHN